MSVKGKRRVFSPTGSTAGQSTADITVIPSIIIIFTVLQKDIYSRITELDTFSDDRKKFKVYKI
jgi:hypothetical protein